MSQSIVSKIYFLANKIVTCRLYDLESDPKRIIMTLYPALQKNDGIDELKKQDREYFLNSDKNFRLVAELDDELISSVVLMFNDPEDASTVEIFSVITTEKYQGSGLSSIMFSYTFDVIRKLRGKKVKLWTDFDNFRAQKFYEKMGFKEIFKTDKVVHYELYLE